MHSVFPNPSHFTDEESEIQKLIFDLSDMPKLKIMALRLDLD